MRSGLVKMLPTKYSVPNHIYLIYTYKEDLAANNYQGCICHKIQPTNFLRSLSLSLSLSLSIYIYIYYVCMCVCVWECVYGCVPMRVREYVCMSLSLSLSLSLFLSLSLVFFLSLSFYLCQWAWVSGFQVSNYTSIKSFVVEFSQRKLHYLCKSFLIICIPIPRPSIDHPLLRLFHHLPVPSWRFSLSLSL